MKRQRFLSEFDSAKPVRKQDLELTPDEHLFLEQSQKIEQASMLNSAYLQSRHPSDLMIYPWEEWDDNEEDEKPGSGVAARQNSPDRPMAIPHLRSPNESREIGVSAQISQANFNSLNTSKTFQLSENHQRDSTIITQTSTNQPIFFFQNSRMEPQTIVTNSAPAYQQRFNDK